MDLDLLKAIIEALLFVSTEPVSAQRLAEVTGAEVKEVERAIRSLADGSASRRGLVPRKVGGGYKLFVRPEYKDYVDSLLSTRGPRGLSMAALEVLSIIAYLQPVTRSAINEIRGVDSSSCLKVLVERGLVKSAGRLKAPGNPTLYVTTDKLLEELGISSIKELPELDLEEAEKQTLRELRARLGL